jgi:hypothetical protein
MGPSVATETSIPVYPEVPPAKCLGDAASFFAATAEKALVQELVEILRREAPLHLQLLTQRILACFELRRASPKSVTRVKSLLHRAGGRLIGDFVWSTAQDPQSFTALRRQGERPEQRRKAQEIPPEEAANAAQLILQQNISLPYDDLIRETAHLLGFSRMGQPLRASMAAGIDLLIKRGACTRDEEQVVLRLRGPDA